MTIVYQLRCDFSAQI